MAHAIAAFRRHTVGPKKQETRSPFNSDMSLWPIGVYYVYLFALSPTFGESLAHVVHLLGTDFWKCHMPLPCVAWVISSPNTRE